MGGSLWFSWTSPNTDEITHHFGKYAYKLSFIIYQLKTTFTYHPLPLQLSMKPIGFSLFDSIRSPHDIAYKRHCQNEYTRHLDWRWFVFWRPSIFTSNIISSSIDTSKRCSSRLKLPCNGCGSFSIGTLHPDPIDFTTRHASGENRRIQHIVFGNMNHVLLSESGYKKNKSTPKESGHYK